ncbi:MAG: 3-phosphoshikimate 1-carboxyvinyltransferase [Clostridia bacterium]|nr:3-phosphoshikimate 1-carboxyvinyltransferase [Clostridia bacterium]
MDISVSYQNLNGQVNAVTSKSDVHRALICAAFADKKSDVKFNSSSQDIEATVACLNSLGAKITKSSDGVQVEPVKNIGANCVLDCGESGSTLRFLLPAAAALGVRASFTGRGRLFQRPLEPLVSLMKEHGVVFEKDEKYPLKISGRMTGGYFEIPGNISSQFISGLLFALPSCGGGTVKIIPPVESKNYIGMTVNTIRKFGVDIIINENIYTVPDKKYKLINEIYFSEGDWSNAAFFLCAAAINGSVCINGLNQKSLQGDKKITEILSRFGAEVSAESDKVFVKSKELNGIEIDASQIPDLVPVLAVTAAFAQGTTKIYNASRLRIKESDRLFAVHNVLTAVGADVRELDDGLIINGKKSDVLSGAAESFNDHRIAMSLAVSCANGGKVLIKNAQAVNKSYPDFFKDFNSLGGKSYVL